MAAAKPHMFKLDPEELKAAQEALGTKDKTETVRQALRLAIDAQERAASVERLFSPQSAEFYARVLENRTEAWS